MKRRVHLVHGIHTAYGSPVVHRLIPYLEAEGFEVFYPDYGYELAVATRAINPMLVGMMMPYVESGDLFVGHSNGCAIGLELMRRGAPIDGGAFINAALDVDVEIPPQVKFLDVYFNQGDKITRVAQVASWLGVVDSSYGEMGHAGYTGSDRRVTNHDCYPTCDGHSAIFNKAPQLAMWGPIIAKTLREKSNG